MAPPYLGPFYDPNTNSVQQCQTIEDCEIPGVSNPLPNQCMASLSASEGSAGGCHCYGTLDGPECRTMTKASKVHIGLAAVVVAYCLYIFAARFKHTMRVVAHGLWVWNASTWSIVWAWTLLLASVLREIIQIIVPLVPNGTVGLISSLALYVQLLALLLSVLTITGAFVESATSMRKLRDLSKFRWPIRILAFTFFVTIAAMILTDNFAYATYLGLALVLILLGLSIAGPLLLYFKFASAHQGRMRPRSKNLSRVNSKQSNNTGGVLNTDENESNNNRDGKISKSYWTVAKELFVRVCVSSKDEQISSDDLDESQSSRDNSLNNPPSTPSIVTPSRSRASTQNDHDLLIDENRSLDVTAVDKVVSRRASELSNDKRSRAGSKSTVVSVASESPSNVSQGGRNRPTSVRIHLNRIGDSLRNMSNSNNRQADSSKLRKKKVKQTDRVLKFLSRVIGLSMRMTLSLLLFVAAALTAIVRESEYDDNENFTVVEGMVFLQAVAVVGCAHSILWFLDYTSRKRVMKAKEEAKNPPRRHDSKDFSKDSKDDSSQQLSRPPSKQELQNLSRSNSKQSLKQKASYYVEMDNHVVTDMSSLDERIGAVVVEEEGDDDMA